GGEGGPPDARPWAAPRGYAHPRPGVAPAAGQCRGGFRGKRRCGAAHRVPDLAVRAAAVIASGGVSPARARPTHGLIDQILALDPGRRGIETFFRPGAALAAARALRRARRVLIVTGCTVKPDMPEPDGPPGAAVLGRALRLLGA